VVTKAVEAPKAEAKKVVKEAPAPPAKAKEVVTFPSLEERIRVRAYELYLRRNGVAGSPEQDWFQAASEIYRESVA
jgi:hypothetical protein